jgi:hypothetical protein
MAVIWDNNNKGNHITLINGFRTITISADWDWEQALCNTPRSTGRYNFEVYMPSAAVAATSVVGIQNGNESLNTYVGDTLNGYGYMANGRYYNDTPTLSKPVWYTGGLIMVAVDLDAKKVWFGLNGVWDGLPGVSGEAYSSITSGASGFYPAASPFHSTHILTGNFDSSNLVYGSPSGFSQWGDDTGSSSSSSSSESSSSESSSSESSSSSSLSSSSSSSSTSSSSSSSSLSSSSSSTSSSSSSFSGSSSSSSSSTSSSSSSSSTSSSSSSSSSKSSSSTSSSSTSSSSLSSSSSSSSSYSLFDASRTLFWHYVLNEDGQPIQNAEIRLYLNDDPTTEANIFLTETSSSFTTCSLANIKTDNNGFFSFWLGNEYESGGYSLRQEFILEWFKAGSAPGQIKDINPWPNAFAWQNVNSGADSEYRNKFVSDFYANKWWTHFNAVVPSASPHDLHPVDYESGCDDNRYNKVVSNKFIDDIWNWSIAEGSETLSNQGVFELQQSLSWTASGDSYYCDISHPVDITSQEVSIILIKSDDERQVMPKKIINVSTGITRVVMDSPINVIVNMHGES